jgi:hypothetical protein
MERGWKIGSVIPKLPYLFHTFPSTNISELHTHNEDKHSVPEFEGGGGEAVRTEIGSVILKLSYLFPTFSSTK